jgi:N-acetylglucosamine malate deacetylase 1
MKYLVVAAHPDDEILGCGGSMARWVSEGHEVHVLIMAEGATSRDASRDTSAKQGELKALKKAALDASDEIGTTSLEFLDFPDNRMDSLDLLDVIKSVEKKVQEIKPSIVLTHHSGDLNVDHSIINRSVLTACRPEQKSTVKKIMSFEVNSSTEWQSPGYDDFVPNLFIDITNFLEKKLRALDCYKSEMKEEPHPRSIQGVRNLAKLRGYSVGLPYAESFMVIREID